MKFNIKSIVVIITTIVVFFTTFGLAQDKESKQLKWDENIIYTIPKNLPNFREWPPINIYPIMEDKENQFGMIMIEALNPQNEDEYILVMFLGQIKNEKMELVIIAVEYTASIKKELESKSTSLMFADVELLKTGRPSFVLSKVKEINNAEWEKFIKILREKFEIKKTMLRGKQALEFGFADGYIK